MTPEQHADNIAKWTNAGLRQSVIDEIAAAVAAERAKFAETFPLTIKTAIEAEREACARKCDDGSEAGEYYAAAIRARGNGSR